MTLADTAASRVVKVREKIQNAARGAGLNAEGVELIAVSKTAPVEKIKEVYETGIKGFGENKVQEFLDKKDRLPADIAWHFIGRLQTNKVRFLVEAACRGQLVLLQSLDRPQLADEIQKQALKMGLRKFACLIQVDCTGEQTKAGFDPGEVETFIRSLPADSVLDVQGLMAMGPNTHERQKIRDCFEKVRKLRDELRVKFPDKGWKTLSMGMSSDYEIAIETGSTLVRVGSAIFGPRADADQSER